MIKNMENQNQKQKNPESRNSSERRNNKLLIVIVFIVAAGITYYLYERYAPPNDAVMESIIEQAEEGNENVETSVDSNENGNMESQEPTVRFSMTRNDIIGTFSSSQYGFGFQRNKVADGKENHIGTRGSMFIQIFGPGDNLTRVSINTQIEEGDAEYNNANLAVIKSFASSVVPESTDWVNNEFNHAIGNWGKDYSNLIMFGDIGSRINCEYLRMMYFCELRFDRQE